MSEMKSHCWRNPRLEGKKEKDKVWPELQSKKRKYDSQMCVRQSSQKTENNLISKNQSEISNQLVSKLSHCDFPELGKIMSRRKQNIGNEPDAIDKDSVIISNDEGDEKVKAKKFVKRSERAQLFRINIQQALENQKSLKNSLAEKKIKCCDRIVETKSNKIYLSKAKRTSKLKQIIVNEREKQKEIKREYKNIEPLKEEVDQLNLRNLKILPDPYLDLDYGRQLSGLNLLGLDYRDSQNDCMIDETVENRRDISKKLENLKISMSDEVNLIDDDLRHDVANIQINELNTNKALNDNINQVLVLEDKGNQFLQNSAFQNYRDKKNCLKFSRRFREYCTNMISPSLNEKLESMVSELFRLQKKLYIKNNVKGRYKRRFYTGFNEVEKHVNLKRIKFVIIVPDLEKIEVEGGLSDAIEELIETCRKQNIPISFGLSRRKLGYLTHRKGMTSCIGISDYGGIEEKLEPVLINLVESKNEFMTLKDETNKTIDLKKIIPEDLLLSERIKILLKVIASTT